MRNCNIRFVALLGAVGTAAVLSVPAAAQQSSIAGKWDVGAGQANYTLEFGWPEEHAKLMGTPSTGRSVVIDPPDGKIPFQPWAMAIRNARDRIHTEPARMKSRTSTRRRSAIRRASRVLRNRGGPFITVFPTRC